jgi:signal transduction histidine kinase
VRTRAGSVSRYTAVVLAAVAVAYGLAAISVAGRHGEFTTYAGRSAGAALVELIAGWALIAAGLLALAQRPARPAGLLAVVAGLAWFAPDWIGWQTGPGTARAVALAAQGLSAAAVVQLALGAPTGSPPSAPARALVMATWLGTVAIGIGRALLYDPLADPHCVSWCAANPVLVGGSRSVGQALDRLELALTLIVTLAVAVQVARRLAHGSSAARRGVWPVAIPAAVFLGAWTFRLAVLVATPGDDPARGVLAASFAVRAAALGALALGLTWALGRAVRGAMAVRRLAGQARQSPETPSLEATLVHATGDSSLRVVFPLRSGERWIDGDGFDVATPEREAHRAVTTILRGGHPVAVVLHDPAILDGPVLEREIGTAAQMAVENERLRAEARVRLRELKASRSRIVATGDAERRRLERDLHDGAQQRLVSLSVALRMTQAGVDARREPGLADSLREADAGLQRAIMELRELAHGIHPVELSDEGFAAAVEALADRAPVRVQGVPGERLPAPVETAAYVVVEEVARRAVGRHDGTTLTVEACHASGELVVEVDDPGETSPERALADLVSVADRVGALDGHFTVEAAEPCGVRVRAELPCG